jgi:hypothetical protein
VQIPVSGRLRSVVVQFAEAGWDLVAIQFIHEVSMSSRCFEHCMLRCLVRNQLTRGVACKVNGKPVECTIHRTMTPHAGEFQGHNRFKHLERMDLEEKEYILQVCVLVETCMQQVFGQTRGRSLCVFTPTGRLKSQSVRTAWLV